MKLAMAAQMETYIKQIRKEGDTVGGVVTCVIKNVPIGLGEPCNLMPFFRKGFRQGTTKYPTSSKIAYLGKQLASVILDEMDNSSPEGIFGLEYAFWKNLTWNDGRTPLCGEISYTYFVVGCFVN